METASTMKTYSINGKEYPVKKEVAVTINGEKVNIPVVGLRMMSDYQLQLSCLNDRLQHPEKYEANEDLPAVIAHIRKWLAEHAGEGR